MTSIRQLKIASDAGEPDSVLALRIDVVAAAVEWHDIASKGMRRPGWLADLDDAEFKLERAVRRYKFALKRRRSQADGCSEP